MDVAPPDRVVEAALPRFSFSAPVMGTEFRVVIYAADSSRAAEAASGAFALADSLERIMSDYRSDSELNRLSATAGTDSFVYVSKPLARILLEAKDISDATGGAFDVTTGALTRLWRRSMRRGTVPPDTAIARTRSSVDYRSLRIDSMLRRVRLGHSGMRLDLGGIAKGFAADRMLELLRSGGYESALVDAGGDIAVGDAPPGEPGWTVSIDSREYSDTTEAGSPVLVLSKTAIATSGEQYRYVEKDGRRYSHIVNPMSGYGTTRTQTVTVLAASAMRADAFASAFAVLPAEDAVAVAESHANLEARILSRSDSASAPVLRQSSGFPAY